MMKQKVDVLREKNNKKILVTHHVIGQDIVELISNNK